MKSALMGFLKTLAVALTTSLVILVVIIAASNSGNLNTKEAEREAELIELQELTLNATLANACELALPVDPDKGRDPELVRECFAQYGIDPPTILDPEGG